MKKPVLIALVIAAAAAFVLSPAGTALSQEVADRPRHQLPQGLQRHRQRRDRRHRSATASSLALREVTVPPVSPKDTIRLIQGGIVDERRVHRAWCWAFRDRSRERSTAPGTVGVFLLPDEESIVKVVRGEGAHAVLRPSSTLPGVSAASPYFASTANRDPGGVPALSHLLLQHERQDGDGQPIRLL